MNQVESHFNEIAQDYDFYKSKNSFYYKNLKKILGSLIPKDKKVFEVGCGTGDLLIYLKPKIGYGMDISGEMIKRANSKYRTEKNLTFSTVWPKEKFDFIFMSDVVEHLENPQVTFRNISGLMNGDAIFICTMANPIWESTLMVAERLGLKMPEGPHKRVVFEDLKRLIKKSEMKIVKHDYKLLIPVQIPFLTSFANKYLEKHLKKLSFVEYFVAKMNV